MKAIWIDDLKIHDILDGTLNFFVQPPIDGLEFFDVRANSFPRSGQDGIHISTAYAGERRITLRGKLYNISSESDFVTQRQNFLKELKPERDGNNTPTRKVLRFTAMDDKDYQVEVQVVGARMPIDGIRSASFIIDLLAHDPFIYSYTENSQTITTYSGGGVVIPVILPATFEAGSGSVATITNAGDAPALPVVRFNGPLTNPRIENATVGLHMALTHTIASGSYIDVDMDNRTIIQGDVTNRLDKKTSASRFWHLTEGGNTVKLTSSIGGESGNAVVTWRDAHTGI